VSPAGDYSILGGYAGGIIAGVIAMRIMAMNIPAHLDMAAPGLALGAVVGRIGDLAIVEHLGSPTNFFLGYRLQPGYDVSPQHDVLETLCDVNEICGPYHHTALYDLLGALVLLGVLLWLQRSWRARHYGQMFAVWMIWYGLQRFLIDFTRLGAARDGVALPDGSIVEPIADAVMGPLTGSQWGALGVAVLGGILLILAGRRTPVVSAEVDAEYIRQQQGEPSDDAELEPAAADPSEGDDQDRPNP
jgi:prolipoprotein diacylglyceryltransferase